MGMYTELVISTRLINDTNAIKMLKIMIGEPLNIVSFPDHPLFQTDRWRIMLVSSSHYFVPECSNLLSYNSISKNWSFINRSDFKNYNNEVDLFLDWLNPYIDAIAGEMIGYSRYEEDDEPLIRRKQ